MHDKLNTQGRLRRRKMHLDSYNCELCILQREENLKHLFIKCSFARNCWAAIGVQYRVHLAPLIVIKHIKRSLKLQFYMEIIILMSWCIWCQRNNWLFNGLHPTVQGCKENFKQEFAMMIHRAIRKHSPDIKIWLDHLS
jgi:hypothetical protein